jgi:hypothetical protein
MYLEVNGITYVPFKAGIKHPKLSWLILMLNRYGIPHLISKGQTLSGPMLYVQQGTIELATGILTQELAVFIARTTNYEEGPDVTITVTIDDLPDNHEFFSLQLQGQEVMRIVEAPPPTVLEVIEVEGTVIHDVIGDITTEIREHLEEKLAQDDDDDDWGFDEVSLEAEDAVVEEPAPAKKKKKDKTVKPTNDPDFDTATEPAPINVPVTGTEFLRADELLAFEDVQFPVVKKPIRMYDVNSSNISAIGAKITDDPLVVTMYIRFKTGDNVYRYNPISTADWNSTLNEAVRRQQGIQEASVGSFYYHTVKVKAEDGSIKCQRLVPESDSWMDVLPKAARTKEIKERAKS